MKNKKIIIIVLVILILIGVIIIFLNNKKEISTPTENISPIETEIKSEVKKSEEKYKNDAFGFEFTIPNEAGKIETMKAGANDYLPANREFVAIFAESSQDFAARVDVYSAPLKDVLKNNSFLQEYEEIAEIEQNDLTWTRVDWNDFLIERNGKTYHVAGESILIASILETFKFK